MNGELQDFPIRAAHSEARSIVAGPDQALWFTDPGTNSIGRISLAGQITEYPLPNESAVPDQIVLGPDHALWYTEVNTTSIGRLDPNASPLTVAPSSATAKHANAGCAKKTAHRSAKQRRAACGRRKSTKASYSR
jgi:streptogramin lyase